MAEQATYPRDATCGKCGLTFRKQRSGWRLCEQCLTVRGRMARGLPTVFEKECETCRKSFLPRRNYARFCSSCRSERARQQSLQWRRENPEWRAASNARSRDSKRNSELRIKYGITLDDFRLASSERHGRCDICLGVASTLCVDHDHNTNQIRGLLCRKCNRSLGLLGDSLAIILSAIVYLSQTAGSEDA